MKIIDQQMKICSLRNDHLLSRYVCSYSKQKIQKKIPFRQENLDWAECVTFSLPHRKFSGVFERRTATGSKAFSLFKSLDATKFVLISVITHIETTSPINLDKTTAQECKTFTSGGH